MSEIKAMQNTDIKLWIKDKENCFSPSVHATQDGCIGINVGGTVIVKPIEVWHHLESSLASAKAELAELRQIANTYDCKTAEKDGEIAELKKQVEKMKTLLEIAKCPACDGSGVIAIQISSRRLVSRDMAMDAGDPSLEGSLYSDAEWEPEQCQWCYEKNEILKKYSKELEF